MFRVRSIALALAALLGCTFFAQGQDDEIKAVLRKAVQAHGGEKVLAKFNAGGSKFKGKLKIMNLDAEIAGESSFQKPDKWRNVLTINIMNKSIEVIQVYDGKKFWVATMGKTQEIKDEKIIKEVRESLQAEGGGSFIEMLKGGYELTSVGEAKVKGKDAVGIRVAKKGQRDVSYFFDKKTHLLIKTEQRSLDAMSGQEFTQEKLMLEYQDKQGVKVPKRIEILKDGEPYIDLEIIDVAIVEKFDDSVFAKP